MKTVQRPAIDAIVNALRNTGEFPIVRTQTIIQTSANFGISKRLAEQTFMTPQTKYAWGKFDLSSFASAEAVTPQGEAPAAPAVPQNSFALATNPAPTRGVRSVRSDEVFIPNQEETFVPWGEYSTIRSIIASRTFFPTYISGMSGNGKTMMVEQACAKLRREYVRIQISPETDEDDLIGGFRLIDGETVFQKGPVLKAMERGAILLIDEIDRGTNKILCLQGVLEGKPVLVKKVGEVVSPAPGFNVIATANTKGRGGDDGRYVAAQIIDDAFIERFVASIDQPYPNHATEKKIVMKHMEQCSVDDEEFCDRLVSWSTVIRKTFESEAIDEVISTRRLCHIVKAYGIFRDRLTAIRMCIARFDSETREAFLDLYTKIDAPPVELVPVSSSSPTDLDDCPF
jgi:MoxR-like ATPase